MLAGKEAIARGKAEDRQGRRRYQEYLQHIGPPPAPCADGIDFGIAMIDGLGREQLAGTLFNYM